jgi:1-acyl-sn-glycerol-3-phosphate acyltransferase
MRARLIRSLQIAELLSVAAYHHGFKVIGNVIDEPDGVIEQHISQLLGRRLLQRLGMRVTVSGLENIPRRGGYCVVSNHASYLDWAVLLGHFPVPLRFIAKRELLWMPVIGSYLRLRGVLIDRQRGVDAVAAIRAAASDDSPWPILIFPEGTRSRDGRMQPFKRKGLQVLAEQGMKLLPVCILGTYEAFSRHDRYIHRGGAITLSIGEAVDPAEGGVDWALREVERRAREMAAERA